MYRRGFFAALVLALAIPGTATAQYVSRAHGPVGDRFSIEPFAGRYFDNVGSSTSRFEDSGWLGGLRLGLETTDRARLIGTVAFSQVDPIAGSGSLGAASGSSDTWMLTGGLELDVVPGDTRGSLSVEAGRVWRRFQAGGAAGSIEQRQEETVIAPGFSIIQRITPRADLRLGVHDYIWFGADPVSHNWTAVVGLRLR
jgi:hypothetical protein